MRRYAQQFYETHPAPDWIELKDLRQLDPVQAAVSVGDSPVAGGSTRSTDQDNLQIQVRPWTWSDAVWHFEDGSTAVYPAYEKIDWSIGDNQ